MTYGQPLEPQSGDKFPLNEQNEARYLGALVLIFSKQYHEPKLWSPKFKEPCAAVTADVVVLDRYDQAGQPEYYQDNMFFHKVVVGQLKAQLNADPTGAKTLARIKKEVRGMGPAWVLGDWGPGDDVLAQQWEATHNRNLGYGTPPQAGPPQQAAPTWGPPVASAQAPAQQWGAPAAQAPAAAAAPPQWTPPAQAAPPVDHTINYPPGLKEFLVSKGVNDFSTLDVQGAIALAGTFG